MAGARGRSSEAEHQLPKLRTRVRFSSPALSKHRRSRWVSCRRVFSASTTKTVTVPHTCHSVPLSVPRSQLQKLSLRLPDAERFDVEPHPASLGGVSNTRPKGAKIRTGLPFSTAATDLNAARCARTIRARVRMQ